MLRRKGSHSGSPSASFENNDTFFKKLLPLALEGKLAIQTKEIDENPSLIIRTAHSGLMADLESNINKYLREPVKATHSESEHSIQLNQMVLDQICAALRLKIQGRDLIAELEEFNQQNARKSIPQPVAGFELDFALAWPDLGRDSATQKSRKTTRASVPPIMRPLVTDSLTKAQSQFIHREEASRERTVVYDNRDFKAWYDINSIDHLFYLLPADDQRLPPYVIAEHDNANAYFLFQLAELKERFESSEAVIQTFTTKPETGSAHYYAGVIFRPDATDPDNISLLLFNPTGNYKKLERVLEVLEGSTLFNSLYLSTDPVQTEKKDGGGLVSCGPISVEFVKHVQCHPEVLQKLPVVTTDEEWLETIPVTHVSLHKLGILPGNLDSLLTDEPRYTSSVEAIRLSHCQELGQLPDDQFNLANEGAQLGFDKDSHNKFQEWEDELNPPEPADDSLLQDFEEDIQSREIRDKQSSDAAPRDERAFVQPASSYSGNRAAFFQLPQARARSSADPELTQQEALQRINNVVTTLNDISDRLLESLNSINRNLSRLSILNEMSINKKLEEHASFDLSSRDSHRQVF